MTWADPDPLALWRWLPVGYVMTVALELPVLLVGLGRRDATGVGRRVPRRRGAAAEVGRRVPRRRDSRSPYTTSQRVAAGLWLTAVTYPIVALVLPLLMWPHWSYVAYVIVAELFAITTECLLFRLLWRGTVRDLAVVALANVVSATLGGWWVAR